MAVMHDSGTLLPRDNAVNRAPTDAEIRQTLDDIRKGLDQGAPRIGMGIAYMPETTREEILKVSAIDAERHATIYLHMRNPGPVEPGVVDSLQEVIADAAAMGAAVHIVHIPSMAFRQTPLALEMIDGAKKRGLDVTTECYPYTAGMTDLASAIFDVGWQERLGISYSDLQWTATTRAPHPRDIQKASEAGRHGGAVLMEALRKMTILPAQRMGLRNNGRIRVGADADITVFDPAQVINRATYEKPAQYSDGIPYVLVKA
jgi:N-acyl-D-aspartate/D-glutamate deacylase